MKPTELLMKEHRVIERVLDCLETLARRCESSGKLESEPAREVVDFLRTYADRCHHGKEEELLFAMLEARGFSADRGPVAVMRFEHEQGRELIQGMDRAIEGAGRGDAAECADFARNASSYTALLRAHIQKEDHCLFPMADQALTQEDQRALASDFDRVEREWIEAGAREKHLRVAEELSRRFRPGATAKEVV